MHVYRPTQDLKRKFRLGLRVLATGHIDHNYSSPRNHFQAELKWQRLQQFMNVAKTKVYSVYFYNHHLSSDEAVCFLFFQLPCLIVGAAYSFIILYEQHLQQQCRKGSSVRPTVHVTSHICRRYSPSMPVVEFILSKCKIYLVILYMLRFILVFVYWKCYLCCTCWRHFPHMSWPTYVAAWEWMGVLMCDRVPHTQPGNLRLGAGEATWVFRVTLTVVTAGGVSI